MASRSTSGFTLIELMIVVVITGILLSYAVPGFTRSMAERRVSNSISVTMGIVRKARNAAEAKQPAHLVVFRPGAGAQGNGIVELLRGQSPRCARQAWLTAEGSCPPPGNRPANVIELCPEYLDLNVAEWFQPPHSVRLRSVTPGSETTGALNALLVGTANNVISICFESSGATYWSNSPVADSNMVWSETHPAGGFLFTAGLVTNGASEGVPRLFSVPLGSSPRRIR